jgi:hypothetical protein
MESYWGVPAWFRNWEITGPLTSFFFVLLVLILLIPVGFSFQKGECSDHNGCT